ncbi:MAG: ABC-2 family transporter protein [Halobacteriovoraceae bacterium]|nr:ABC-2 family transporter protein [Halobacteriovoraceae bacterium]
MITKELEKWIQTIKVSWLNYTQYRVNFILMFLGPTLIFFLVKWSLWTTIYQSNQKIINGLDYSSMISYHFWVLIVSLLSLGHASFNLSEDIRMGRISTYLIYPFNFWEFHTANFIAFQILQFFIATTTIVIATTLLEFNLPSFHTLFIGYFYCFIISLFWYSVQFLTGIMAFWLDETWILRVLFSNITIFLSGSIIPLNFFPSWSVKLLEYTPFPHMAYFAALIFQGKNVDIIHSLSILILWTIITCLCSVYIWKKGLRLYTAAGM